MGPHDLLCRWCSTFVGKDKKFCSIFCESRFTRSKRRKLAIKRPMQSESTGQTPEFESPRTSKSNFTKKEQFLDDVISAMKLASDKPDEKSTNGRQLGDENGEPKDANTSPARKTIIPKLDLNSTRKDSKLGISSARKYQDTKPEMLKSKTLTIYKAQGDSKIPITSNGKDGKNGEKQEAVTIKRDTENRARVIRDKSASKRTDNKVEMTMKEVNAIATNAAIKETVPDFGVPAPLTKTRSALDLEHRVRSSGYGAPVNPKLRPMALKPRSASFITNAKRQSSASSVKSNKIAELRPKKLEPLPDLLRETSRQIEKDTSGKWELVPNTIEEETNKTVTDFLNTSLEGESPTTTVRTKPVNTSPKRSIKPVKNYLNNSLDGDSPTTSIRTKAVKKSSKDFSNSSFEGESPSTSVRTKAVKKSSKDFSNSSFEGESPSTSVRTKAAKKNTKDVSNTSFEGESPTTSVRTKPVKKISKTNKTMKDSLNTSNENESPASSVRTKAGKKTSSERSALNVLREESTASDLLDTSQIQDRLSSIKRKVEARRRGRDSRSSMGSDFDSSFMDSSIDLTTDRDVLDTSKMKSKTLSARISARSNITRISKTFHPSKQQK